jgi:glucosyl-3-phosphoglycerate synthase
VTVLTQATPTQATPTGAATQSVSAFVASKGGLTVAACIPARNEAATVGAVVEQCEWLRNVGVLDEVVVVDDGSTDATAAVARRAGAVVERSPLPPGKGEALSCAVATTTADLLVFLDADVRNFSLDFVVRIATPLLHQPETQLVKATYRRPLHGLPDEGGRVTELVARPLLERFFPELATVGQPLAGECAVRRSAVEGLPLDRGYGIEIGLLIDVYTRFGRAAISEVDLGERVHRNRPLRDLRPHSRAVLDAVLTRV